MLLGKSYRRCCSCPALLLLFLVAAFAVDAFNNNRIPSSHHQATMSTAKKQQLNDGDDDSSPPTTLQPIKAGFIGCGTIASAIATSLATPDHKTYLSQAGLSLSSICVTRRSESKSTKLKENFPEVVTVYESADEVVANSDIVFLCILPQHVDSVLEDLAKKGVWRTEEHTLVSLVVREY